MGFLTYFSGSSKVAVNVVEKPQVPDTTTEELPTEIPDRSISEVNSGDSVPTSPKDIPIPLSPTTTDSHDLHAASKPRRFSFRNFAAPRHDRHEAKHTLSAVEEHEKRAEAAAALSKRKAKPLLMTSDRRAEESALMVRDLIVGPTAASPSVTRAVARPQMSKLKSQLMKPKSANKVIHHLRALPAEGVNAESSKKTGPIHAVCLAHTDEDENTLHFSKLSKSNVPQGNNVMADPVEMLSNLFSEMNVVDLIQSPDFGLGQPGDGNGILAGALPTAETVLKGVEQITPQLMALGYATGRAIVPDHAGLHPPTDRMSVLTYWWGLEIVMPPPTLALLKSAHSVSGTAVNFLSALALVNNGVREILPFVRYIAQFLDFEFKNIEAQDQGNGVVCAATWIMPAAMVPRPWDFTPPTEILLPPTPPPEGVLGPPSGEGRSNQDKTSPVEAAPVDRPDPSPEVPTAPGQSSPETSPNNGTPVTEIPDSGASPSPVISPIPVLTPLAVAANA